MMCCGSSDLTTSVIRGIPEKSKEQIRADGRITMDNKVLIFDVSLTNGGTPSYLKNQFKYNLARLKAEQSSAVPGPIINQSVTPAVAQRHREKNVKYAPILNKIRDIERKGRSNLRTIFNPCVITHNGELGTGMNDSIEVLAGFAKKRANDSESGTYRGELPAKAASIQRQHLRAAICCTLATGVGRILRTAGYPIGKKRHKQQGIHYDFADSPGPPAA